MNKSAHFIAVTGVVAAAGMMISTSALADDGTLLIDARDYFDVIPAEAVVIEGNEATEAKVELGKMLYFEKRISKSQTISCNSCHNLSTGGVDLGKGSVGHKWAIGGRNAPTVLNSAYNLAQFWDGRAATLEDQAGGPPLNPIEMANTKEGVEHTIRSIPGYSAYFKAAYPSDNQPITYTNMTKAIAVFEATLNTPNSSFDKWLGGDEAALNASQKRGLRTFMDNGCTACHNGAAVGANSYQIFGVVEAPSEAVRPAADKGRSVVTGDEDDDYAFKVPTLRNIALTAPYFHSGETWALADAVDIMARTQMGVELDKNELADVVAFLESLTGDQPVVTYPILPPSVATTPRPQP